MKPKVVQPRVRSLSHAAPDTRPLTATEARGELVMFWAGDMSSLDFNAAVEAGIAARDSSAHLYSDGVGIVIGQPDGYWYQIYTGANLVVRVAAVYDVSHVR